MKLILLLLISYPLYGSEPHTHHHKKETMTITIEQDSPSKNEPSLVHVLNSVKNQPRDKKVCCNDRIKVALIAAASAIVSSGITAAVTLKKCQ